MEKKFEWSKELEDALRKANIPEEKIAALREKKLQPDVEKLSFDRLDGVSGGTQQTVDLDGVEVSVEDFNNLFLAMAEVYGFDIALSMFRNYCGGFMCDEMQPGRSLNTNYNTDKDLMGEVLYRYWCWRETGSPYAHP